jgi:putative hydrolase of the HAD superfamily
MPLIRVFDLGNVLLFVNEDLFFERLRARCRAPGDCRAVFVEQYDRARVDRGGDFAAVHRRLLNDIGLQMDFDEFTHSWNDIFTANPPMLELVRNSPRPRYLLSNTNEPHVTWIRGSYPEIFPLFDGCVLSNEVGVRKPDPRIYRHVESLSGAPPGRHVFIDDVSDYAQGARDVGWHAIHFRAVDDCLERLAALEAEA